MAGLPAYRGPWDRRTAAHLIYRAGFGAPAETIGEMAAAGMRACVGRLVDFEEIADSFPKPGCSEPVADFQEKRKSASKEQKQQMLKQLREQGQELKMWWIQRMATTQRPFQEKLTLFWHGHFATSIQKVKLPYFMWLQNETLRRNAAGNWRKMLKAVSRDPAMVIWLDNISNRANGPNENYARELMELFTLGEGNYSEKDIKESARAFTGYSIDRNKQEFAFRKNLHDEGSKHFFNRAGNFDGDDIVDIILSRPQAPRFIVRKIWEFFAYPSPSDELVDELAAVLKGANYEFAPLFKTIFSSEEFYSERAVKKQIKSPVQWLVGSVLALHADLMPTRMVNNVMKLLGQELFEPPNVKGWDGGAAWITTSSLLTRYNLANAMVNGVIPDEMVKSALAARKLKDKKAEGGGADDASAAEMAEQGMTTEARAMEEQVGTKLKQFMHRKLERLVQVDKFVDAAAVADARGAIERLRDVLYLDGMPDKELASVVEYLGKDLSERKLRGAVHLLMSTPHYQLC